MDQLTQIANELVCRANWMKDQPRLCDDDEGNNILLNIKFEDELEMFDYLNR